MVNKQAQIICLHQQMNPHCAGILADLFTHANLPFLNVFSSILTGLHNLHLARRKRVPFYLPRCDLESNFGERLRLHIQSKRKSRQSEQENGSHAKRRSV